MAAASIAAAYIEAALATPRCNPSLMSSLTLCSRNIRTNKSLFQRCSSSPQGLHSEVRNEASELSQFSTAAGSRCKRWYDDEKSVFGGVLGSSGMRRRLSLSCEKGMRLARGTSFHGLGLKGGAVSAMASGETKEEDGRGSLAYKALLVDVGGTLLQTVGSVPDTYAAIGAKYGVMKSPAEIKQGFREAFSRPWPERLRYEGDGKRFWRSTVAHATGSSDPDYFEELYQHYARGSAWKVDTGAVEALELLKSHGVKLAVVSNFDTRLRPILRDLGVHDLFDTVVMSAEVGFEKPAAEIFLAALDQLKITDPQDAVHVGDDAVADVEGAKVVGLHAWLWKRDIYTFQEIVDKFMKVGVTM